ncbi:MAG TPA: DUF5522 domain-containing protein [Cyclobacteriaceae bacterium]|nr:DUF5522 domain-containing protein [Cyclobacteriaceae bacterium]
MKKPEKKEKPESSPSPDFYWEGGYMVFTEAYHRKRGYCCQSGCRHCPYGFKKEKVN